MQGNTPANPAEARCERCWKRGPLCFCADITPSPSRLRLLVLQHPREARDPRGTARLASLAIEGAVHRVGLSWRSLGQALGKPAVASEWAVLYLGGLKESRALEGEGRVHLRDRKGQPVDAASLKGLIVLDGNWKQAKTLWWRNPWLLKLTRAVLVPQSPSGYGPVRKQPRRECLSTIESVAESLEALDPGSPSPERLRGVFRRHVARVAGATATAAAADTTGTTDAATS